MQVILNIGLNGIPADESFTNGRANPLVARQAMQAAQALRRHGFQFTKSALYTSETEPTLVLEAFIEEAPTPALEQVAEALNQDCIACYIPSARAGRLIGPRAAAWGDFNPEYFITLNGSRLVVAASV